MDNRRHQRVETANMVADLSDGKGFFSGAVSNISRFGILLEDIPNKLNGQAENLSIVISANNRNFKVSGIAQWVSEDRYRKKMGVKILDAPWNWTEFVRECEPIDDDVWGSVA
jgi:hypothetical protein